MRSVDEVYLALSQRNRFKARYSTRGSGSASRSVDALSAQISVDMSASLEFTAGPRTVIDGCHVWKFEGQYTFRIENKFHDIGVEADGEVSINDISEKTGGDTIQVSGALLAEKRENSAVMGVFLEAKPFEKLKVKGIHKDDGYAQIDEQYTIAHAPFFELIETHKLPTYPGLFVGDDAVFCLDGWEFRDTDFTRLESWQTKGLFGSQFAYLLEIEVLHFQEIAITDGETLPTTDDCVPVIEAIDENSGAPIQGKEFSIAYPNGTVRNHVTDAKGQIRLIVKDGESYTFDGVVDSPQRGEARYRGTETT